MKKSVLFYKINKMFYFEVLNHTRGGDVINQHLMYKADYIFQFNYGVFEVCYKRQPHGIMNPGKHTTINDFLKNHRCAPIIHDRYGKLIYKGTICDNPYEIFNMLKEEFDCVQY